MQIQKKSFLKNYVALSGALALTSPVVAQSANSKKQTTSRSRWPFASRQQVTIILLVSNGAKATSNSASGSHAKLVLLLFQVQVFSGKMSITSSVFILQKI
jgi:hypothetical protein